MDIWHIVLWILAIIAVLAIIIFIYLKTRKKQHGPPPLDGGDGPKTLNVEIYKSFQNSGSGTAVAFSGGGSRSLSCTLGQLRGLQALDLLEDVKCISAVSGGSWASSLYTYLPESISDENFLGKAVEDPGKLTLWYHGDVATALDRFSENNMGFAATNVGIEKMLVRAAELYHEGVPADDLWIHMIGEYIFEPFGLFDPNEQKFFTDSEEWFHTNIKRYNPHLVLENFHIPKKGRPELVVNFNVAPQSEKPNLFPVESTQKVAGILQSYPASWMNTLDFGGGYIDPFGFNSPKHSGEINGRVKLVTPDNIFGVHTASGLSSAAFVETIEQHPKWPIVESIIPKKNYWPPMNMDQPSQKYGFADGGNLEDTGVAALLRRQFKSIISFVNGSTPLGWDDDNNQVIIGAQVAVLFGIQPKTKKDGKYLPYEPFPENYKPGDPLQDESYATTAHNKVFKSEDFFKLIDSLWISYNAGGTSMLCMENVEVVDQPHLGVKGYTIDKLLWVYNQEVGQWRDKLEDEIKTELDLKEAGAFPHFPYYETMEQLELTTSQVNLLAHLSCWNVISDNRIGNPGEVTNESIFKEMFKG